MNKSIIEDILGIALYSGCDFSEVFIENRKSNSMTSSGGDIEEISSGEEYGIGIRIFKGINSIYTYTNDFGYESLMNTAKDAAIALSQENTSKDVILDRRKKQNSHRIIIDPNNAEIEKRVDIIREIYKRSKEYSKKISQVQSSILDYTQDVIIANSDGRYISDRRTRCRFSVSAIASSESQMNVGFFAPGAHKGFEFFDEVDYSSYAREAARIAVTMLDAQDCPAGKMPVIIDNGFGGVIFHEACGHGLEATSVAKKTSVYEGKINKQIASSIVTAIDDGSLKNQWGSANFDDEGTKTQENILIEKGVLKSYLIDKLNARRMGMVENGASRRQSYKYAPTSRMSNTYIANGNSTLPEMIESIDYGIYAKNMGGGSVNPATGEFNFSVLEGYLIEKGKIIKPVRGASLIGRGQDILYKIDMVGNNLLFGQGMCGSISGSIPANVGQPAIKVREIVVGGSSK